MRPTIPTIRFHAIERAGLSPVRTFEAAPTFAHRELVLVSADGSLFKVGLFADRAEQLRIVDPEVRKLAEDLLAWMREGELQGMDETFADRLRMLI